MAGNIATPAAMFRWPRSDSSYVESSGHSSWQRSQLAMRHFSIGGPIMTTRADTSSHSLSHMSSFGRDNQQKIPFLQDKQNQDAAVLGAVISASAQAYAWAMCCTRIESDNPTICCTSVCEVLGTPVTASSEGVHGSVQCKALSLRLGELEKV